MLTVRGENLRASPDADSALDPFPAQRTAPRFVKAYGQAYGRNRQARQAGQVQASRFSRENGLGSLSLWLKLGTCLARSLPGVSPWGANRHGCRPQAGQPARQQGKDMDYAQRKEEYRQKIKSFRLIDDTFMRKVFSDNLK